MQADAISSNKVPKFEIPTLKGDLEPTKKLAIEILRNNSIFSSSRNLKAQLRNLSSEDLQSVVQAVVFDFVSNIDQYDPVAVMHKLAELIPFDKFKNQDSAKNLSTELLKEVKKIITIAKLDLEASSHLSASAKTRVNDVLDGAVRALESVITAFGIAAFFRKSSDPMEGMFKAQQMTMLLTLFGVLSGLLIPIAGPKIGVSVVGGLLLGIAALSVVYAKIKPMPSAMVKGTNVTDQYHHGVISRSGGRDEIRREIFEILRKNDSSLKQHPLILAPSGTGKTTTVNDLAIDFAEGKYGEEYRDYKVFIFNCGELAAHKPAFGGANEILNTIREEMGRHAGKIIIVLDEIHALCEDDQNRLSEQLKSKLDPSPNGFPKVIGITTYEDYYDAIYVKNSALDRRFQPVNLKNTNEKETIDILSHFAIRKAPNLIMKKGVLKAIFDISNEMYGVKVAQPAAAIKVLSLCISRLSYAQKTENAKNYEERQQIYKAHIASAASEIDFDQSEEELIKINDKLSMTFEELEENLRLLKTELEKEEAARNSKEKKSHKYVQAKKAMYRAALEAEKKILKKSDLINSPELMNEFFILKDFLVPLIAKYLCNNEAPEITEKLIRKVIKNDIKKRDEKVAKVSGAKRNIDARQVASESAEGTEPIEKNEKR